MEITTPLPKQFKKTPSTLHNSLITIQDNGVYSTNYFCFGIYFYFIYCTMITSFIVIEAKAMKTMKPLNAFISERSSLSEAARALGQKQQTVYQWAHSNRKFYVKKVGKEFKVFEEK